MSTAMLTHLTAGTLLVALVLIVSTRQPRTRIRLPVLLALNAVLLFVAGDLGTLLARDLPQKHAALALLYTGTIWVAPSLWLLANRALEEKQRPTPAHARVVLIGSIAFAALGWLAAITNPLHGAFLTPVLGGRNIHHGLWYLTTGGTYAVIFAASAICVAVALDRHESRRIRQQALTLGLGMLVPFVANVLYNSPFWTSSFDPTIPALAVTAVSVSLGIYGAGLFGLSPVSIRAALASDPSGVLIVGRGGQSIFVNEAARRFLAASPVPVGRAPLERLAARLASADADAGERVPAIELANLARGSAKERAGTLYRLAPLDPDDGPEWVWISALPIRSRWRRQAADCFRIQDVTRLWQSEIERSRLETQMLRRRAAAREIDEPTVEPVATAPRPRRSSTTDWRAGILERLARYEVFSERTHPKPREIETVLTHIESDPNLCRDLELMPPERAWHEFERRLRRLRDAR